MKNNFFVPLNHWREYLARFQHSATTQGFVEFLALATHRRDAIPAFQLAPLQFFALINDLFSAYLLACVQTPPEETTAALEEIDQATQHIQYDETPPAQVTAEVRALYPSITTNHRSSMMRLSPLLRGVFARYTQGQYDLNHSVDALFKESCGLSLADQDDASLSLMMEAGALMLRGGAMWRGWQDEGSPTFQKRAIDLYAVFEIREAILPLQAIEAERLRADALAVSLQPQGRDNAESRPPKRNKKSDRAARDEIQRLVELTQRDEPLSDAEIQRMGLAYTAHVEQAKEILFNISPLPEDIAQVVQIIAVQALGILRCTDPEVISSLITYVVDAFADEADDQLPNLDDDIDFDGVEFKLLGKAVQALQRIGPPALPICMTFMRNSFHRLARFEIARAVGVVGRGSDEIFDYLREQFENADVELGKTRWAMPLALLHDDRAIPLLAQGLEATRDEAEEIMREMEAIEYLDALDELSAIISLTSPPPDDHKTAFTPVEVRGYGLIDDAAPVDWVPPAERVEDDDDFEEDDFDEDFEVADDNDLFNDKAASPFVTLTPRAPASLPMATRMEPSSFPKAGRNDPCPCGSGKKYKHCHGKSA